MASFISALALFILVLSNRCFTLPILHEQVANSTSSSINDDTTTRNILNLRLVADDETSVLPNVDSKRSTDEHMEYQLSTPPVDLSGKKFVKALRAFDEYSTSKPMTIATKKAKFGKVDGDISILQVDQIDRRSINNEFENGTQQMQVQTTTNDFSFTSTMPTQLLTTQTSTSTSTIIPILHTKRSSSPTVMSTVYTTVPSTSTTTTSSSTVIPIFDTIESSTSTSTSTRKYVGHLKDENKSEEEYVSSTKPTRIQRKPGVSSTKKSPINIENTSEEDTKESTIPTAVFDQQALDKVSNIPNDFLILDESNDLVVTDFPNRTFTTTTTMKALKKQEEGGKPLNQGEESSHSEEKESHH